MAHQKYTYLNMTLLAGDEGFEESSTPAPSTYSPSFWKKEIAKFKSTPYSPLSLHVDIRKLLETTRERSKGDRPRLAVLAAILEKNLLPGDILGKPLAQVYSNLAA